MVLCERGIAGDAEGHGIAGVALLGQPDQANHNWCAKTCNNTTTLAMWCAMHIKTFSIVKCIWKECQNLHFRLKNRTGVGNFELCSSIQRLHFSNRRHHNELCDGILNTTRCGASQSDHPFKSYCTLSDNSCKLERVKIGLKEGSLDLHTADFFENHTNARSHGLKLILKIAWVFILPFSKYFLPMVAPKLLVFENFVHLNFYTADLFEIWT